MEKCGCEVDIFKDSYLIPILLQYFLLFHKDFQPFAKKKYVSREFKELDPSIVIDHSELKKNYEYKIILFFVIMFMCILL